MPAPGMIYRDGAGNPALYVRTEQRPGAPAPEDLYVVVKDRAEWQRWATGPLDGFEVVNDTTGRVEAVIAWAEAKALQEQRDVLLKVMKVACSMLPDRAADELRDVYRDGMANVVLVSL